MTVNAWRHGARIVAARPLTFTVYLAHYLAFYTLPLASGLVLRAVFDAKSVAIITDHEGACGQYS